MKLIESRIRNLQTRKASPEYGHQCSNRSVDTRWQHNLLPSCKFCSNMQKMLQLSLKFCPPLRRVHVEALKRSQSPNIAKQWYLHVKPGSIWKEEKGSAVARVTPHGQAQSSTEAFANSSAKKFDPWCSCWIPTTAIWCVLQIVG